MWVKWFYPNKICVWNTNKVLNRKLLRTSRFFLFSNTSIAYDVSKSSIPWTLKDPNFRATCGGDEVLFSLIRFSFSSCRKFLNTFCLCSLGLYNILSMILLVFNRFLIILFCFLVLGFISENHNLNFHSYTGYDYSYQPPRNVIYLLHNLFFINSVRFFSEVTQFSSSGWVYDMVN